MEAAGAAQTGCCPSRSPPQGLGMQGNDPSPSHPKAGSVPWDQQMAASALWSGQSGQSRLVAGPTSSQVWRAANSITAPVEGRYSLRSGVSKMLERRNLPGRREEGRDHHCCDYSGRWGPCLHPAEHPTWDIPPRELGQRIPPLQLPVFWPMAPLGASHTGPSDQLEHRGSLSASPGVKALSLHRLRALGAAGP